MLRGHPRGERRQSKSPTPLYDWGATVTLVTHAAAVRIGLERKRQTPASIAGLGGRCTMVDSYYMVPVVDGNDKVRVVKPWAWTTSQRWRLRT